MNIQEFYADNLGKQFCNAISNALNPDLIASLSGKIVSFRRTVIDHNFAEKSKIMAINITTITQLISDFRALSQKDSISPESLGVLLQRLTDLINSAASDADYKAIYDAFQKFVANIAAVPTALYKLEQGSADRNDVLMNITTSHLINGITMTLKDAVFIRQATTERAGAMRAQQVSDLNSTRTGLASLQKSHTELAYKVSTLETTVSENGELLARVADESNLLLSGKT